MSALSLRFHPFAMLMICLLVLEFQIVLRSDLAIPDKLFFLAAIFTMQIVLFIFESWLNEHFEAKDKDEGQVFWGIPKSYGGEFTTVSGE